MKTTTTIVMIIACIFQLSSSCYSQESANTNYTDIEIIKLANYIKILEAQNAAMTSALNNAKVAIPNNQTLKKKDKNNFVDNSHCANCYTNDEVLKLAKYIEYLEKINIENTLVYEQTLAKE